MKHFPTVSLLLAASFFPVTVCLQAVETAPARPARENRLIERIDALLRPHLKPTPLPVGLPNPFIVVRGTADFTETREPASAVNPRSAPPMDNSPLPTDAEILADCVARLKIGGTMQVSGVTQLLLNQELYKEGDHITFEGKDALLHVQLIRLSPDELTLRLREATQVIRLKNPAKSRNGEP